MTGAKYIGKYYGTGYERNYIFLEYEYRGMKYEVYINTAKGNEPLAWQHRMNQDNIDKLLDTKSVATESSQVGFDKFWSWCEGKDVDWD